MELKLDRFGRRVLGLSHVVGRIGEGLAGAIGIFLEPGADLANSVLRAAVPGDARFAVYINPSAVELVQRAHGAAVFSKRDHECIVAVIVDADNPATHKLTTRR